MRRANQIFNFVLHNSQFILRFAEMAMESEITLHNQERGKEWEYLVIAVNKTGEGMPSNTVMAVL